MLPERATPEAPQGSGRKRTCTRSIRSGEPLFDSGQTQAASKVSNFGGGVKYEMEHGGWVAACLISRNSLRNVYDSAHT